MSKTSKLPAEAIRDRKAAWQELVVLCRKCGGKLKGGFGEKGRAGLRSALADELRELGRRREIRVIEAGCFGVCPKRAVVACHSARPARLLIVPEGQSASLVLDALGVSPTTGPA